MYIWYLYTNLTCRGYKIGENECIYIYMYMIFAQFKGMVAHPRDGLHVGHSEECIHALSCYEYSYNNKFLNGFIH